MKKIGGYPHNGYPTDIWGWWKIDEDALMIKLSFVEFGNDVKIKKFKYCIIFIDYMTYVKWRFVLGEYFLIY